MVRCLLKAVTDSLLREFKNIARWLNQFWSSIIARMEASYCYLGDSGRSPVIEDACQIRRPCKVRPYFRLCLRRKHISLAERMSDGTFLASSMADDTAKPCHLPTTSIAPRHVASSPLPVLSKTRLCEDARETAG
jgi:hypothetical protein